MTERNDLNRRDEIIEHVEDADLDLYSLYVYGEATPDQIAQFNNRLETDAAFRDKVLPLLELEATRRPVEHTWRNSLDVTFDREVEGEAAREHAVAWLRREPARSPVPVAMRQRSWDRVTAQLGMARTEVATGQLLDEKGQRLPTRPWENRRWMAMWANVLGATLTALKFVALAACPFVLWYSLGREFGDARQFRRIPLGVADTTISVAPREGIVFVDVPKRSVVLWAGRYRIRSDSNELRVRVDSGVAAIAERGVTVTDRGLPVRAGQDITIRLTEAPAVLPAPTPPSR